MTFRFPRQSVAGTSTGVAAPASAILSLSSSSFSFGAVAGGSDPTPQFLLVQNAGNANFAGVQIDRSLTASWLTVVAAGGFPGSVTIAPATGALTQGTYSTTFDLTDQNASNSPARVTVTFVVSSAAQSPIISVSGSTLTFTGTAGGSASADQSILVTNVGGGTFTNLAVGNLTYGGGGSNWLKPPTGGTFLTGTTISGHLDPSGLSAGNYTATFDVTDSGATNSPVTITVNAAVSAVASPVLNLSSQVLNFNAVATGANPAAQTITITNTGGGSLAGPTTGAASYTGTHTGWISSKPVTTNVAGQNYTLTLNLTTPATVGDSKATFSLSDASATNSPITITVNFHVTAVTPPGNFPAPAYYLPNFLTHSTQTNRLTGNPFTFNSITDPDPSTYFGPAGTANPGVAQVRTVANVSDLGTKAALCVDGDILQITGNFTISSQFQWPKRADHATRPTGWVLVTTNGTLARGGSTIAQGERVTEADFIASSIPKVTVNNATDSSFGMCMAAAASGFYFYRTYFKNARTASPAGSLGILYWGYMTSGSDLQTNVADMPKQLKMEQNCWDSGWTDGGSIFCWRAVIIHGQYYRLIQNAFTNFCTPSGNDSQALYGSNGLGSGEIWDNTIEGGAENIMFGGAATQMGSMTYNDNIWIHGNYLHKPSTWIDTTTGTPDRECKNLIEMKCANRVVIEDNYFENNNGAAQQQDVVLKCQVFGSQAAYIKTQNIWVRNNYSTNGVGSFEVDLGNSGNPQPTNSTGRIQINNNAWVSRSTQSSAVLKNKIAGEATASRPLLDVIIDHNYCSDTNSFINFSPTVPAAPIVGKFTLTNNLFVGPIATNNSAVMGSSSSPNITGLNAYCGTTGWTCSKNAGISAQGASQLYGSPSGSLVSAPYSNVHFSSLGTLGDTTQASSVMGKYLNSGTTPTVNGSVANNPLYQTGTDGKDIGPDWGQLAIALTANS